MQDHLKVFEKKGKKYVRNLDTGKVTSLVAIDINLDDDRKRLPGDERLLSHTFTQYLTPQFSLRLCARSSQDRGRRPVPGRLSVWKRVQPPMQGNYGR